VALNIQENIDGKKAPSLDWAGKGDYFDGIANKLDDLVNRKKR